MKYVHEEKVFPEIMAWADELTDIRHEIHKTPEIGFNTENTARRIAENLKKWNADVVDTETVKNGVICVINGNRPGPTVAFRADIDALPMDDCSTNPWKSQNDGRAHACGHDGHQTWAMGTMRYLAQTRDFPGRIIGIFQPAEEIAKGAQAVVEAGVLQKYDVREIYAAHSEPLLEKGKIGFKEGPLQASSDSFWITVHGKGTHGGRPHLGVDPIPVGAQIVSALQTIIARKLNPMDTGVVSVCSINAGRFETVNVVPHQLTLSGTIRTFSPEARVMIEEELKRLVTGITEANNCTVDIKYQHDCAAVINHKEQTEAGIAVAEELFGKDSVVPRMDPFMSSEDFSEYINVIPGSIMRIGVRDDNHTVSLHNQAFDFNDEVLPAACTLFASILKSRLEKLANS